VDYSAFVSNGPKLVTAEKDSTLAGSLAFENIADNNNGKALGGKFGMFLFSELKVGYSAMYSQVGSDNTAYVSINALLQSIDYRFAKNIMALKSKLMSQGQWFFTEIDKADYGSGSYDNVQNGGYLELSLRPSLVKQKFLKNIEAVVRFDLLNKPDGATVNKDETKLAVGLLYWLGYASGIKAAIYPSLEHAHAENAEEEHAHNEFIFLQIFSGF